MGKADSSTPTVTFRELECGPSEWSPADSNFKVTLNVALDACIIPSQQGHSARVDYAHLVVLDNFFGEEERLGLLEYITEPGWDHSQGPPLSKWERNTYDSAFMAPTWGLKDAVLSELANSKLPAKLQIQTRLARLYPEVTLAHQPSDHIQTLQPVTSHQTGPLLGTQPSAHDRVRQAEDEGVPHAKKRRLVNEAGRALQGCSGAQIAVSGGSGLEASTRPADATAAVSGGRKTKQQFGSWEGEGKAEPCEVGERREGKEQPCEIDERRGEKEEPCKIDERRGEKIEPCEIDERRGEKEKPCEIDERRGHKPEPCEMDERGEEKEWPCEIGERRVDCAMFLGNASVPGDHFSWHVDADPATFPDSPWVRQFGHYCNREPGRPLFVSLLVYLCDDWPRSWDAETLFLDSPTDTGIIVRPKKYRAVLMDQDILHRVSVPSQDAHGPRYSLVWKLVFLPKTRNQTCSIARREWGVPTMFGSAARLAAVAKELSMRAPVKNRQ